jgi:ATP-dependent Clp protease ATP-binding subunit ClpA
VSSGIGFEKFNPGEPNEPSYSPDLKEVIDQSAKEAEGRSDMIGTEHVLLALLTQSTGIVAATISDQFKMNIEDLRKVASEFVERLAQGAAEGAKTGASPVPAGEQLAVMAVLQPGLSAASIDRVMDAIALIRGVAAVDVMKVTVKEKEEAKSPILTGKMATPDRRILR